jgi:hypothetical protein
MFDPPITVGCLCEAPVVRRLTQTLYNYRLGPTDAVAPSEPEQKRLVAADISQRLLIRRAKELIAQPKPAAELLRRLYYGTRPTLACEVRIEFRKRRVLSKGQQCDPRAFRYGQFKIAGDRKAHYCLADQRCLSCPIHQLASFALPSRSRLGELMV